MSDPVAPEVRERWERDYDALPGCPCGAYSESECGCGNYVDHSQYMLEREVAHLRNLVAAMS